MRRGTSRPVTASPTFACPATHAPRLFAASTNVRRFPAIRRATTCRHCRRALSEARLPACSTAPFPAMRGFVEIGCGTGQMCLYLARADRIVVGADLTRASLLLGAAAATPICARQRLVHRDRSAAPRTEGGRLRRGHLFGRAAPHPGPAGRRSPAWRRWRGQAASSCSGSTMPSRGCRCGCAAWWRGFRVSVSFRSIRCCARGSRSRPVARRGCATSISIQRSTGTRSPRSRAGLPRTASSTCRTYPSAVAGDEPEDLFTAADDNWRFEGWLAQLGWMFTLGHEGGLFFTIGRRLSDHPLAPDLATVSD